MKNLRIFSLILPLMLAAYLPMATPQIGGLSCTDSQIGGLSLDNQIGGLGLDNRIGGLSIDNQIGGIGLDNQIGGIGLGNCVGVGLSHQPQRRKPW